MRPLNADEIVDKAHRATGLGPFHSDSYREGLDILVADANDVAAYHDAGRDHVENLAVHYLGLRLRVDDYIRQNPRVVDAPIVAPVVVLGIPRTGTTLASNLLATDPARRSLLTWEADNPVPPAEPGMLTTDPRALAALEQERQKREAFPEAGKYYMSSQVFPTECTFVQGHDVKSLYWQSFGRLPQYSEWILGADMTSAYDHHRRFLQVLQHKNPGSWNLKMPSHALHIRWLLQAYPDARIVWTHRDPYTATGSLFSLISTTHGRVLPEPDREWIAEHYPSQLAEHARRPMALRKELGQDSMFDLYYSELTREPIAAMRRLYDWLGDPFTDEVEAGMTAWLRENPQGKWGVHDYKLGAWGVTVQDLEPFFEEYLGEYDVEAEGKGQG